VTRLVLVLSLALSGCALSFDSTHLGVPATMAEAAPRAGETAPTGTPFKVTRHPVFLLWGLATAGQPNLEDVLAGQVGTGTGIANLKIKVRSRWHDLLVTGLTLGVISPRSVTFEGLVLQQAP
jgi:protein-S-isoprenylcysteine O-methyltransferase Ste14